MLDGEAKHLKQTYHHCINNAVQEKLQKCREGCKEELVQSWRAKSDDRNLMTYYIEILRITVLGHLSMWCHISVDSKFDTHHLKHLKSHIWNQAV
jgi:hypothetical protein